MSRTRPLVAVVLTLGSLAAPCLAAAPTTAAPSASSARAAAAPAVRFTTSYGGRAVTVPEGSRAYVRFDGRKGDVVTVDDRGRAPARLFRRGRAVRPTWEDSAVYRLPRSGRFTFRVSANNGRDQKVRLVKARVHELAVDGRPVRTPRARAGYVDMVAVRLRDDDRVTVDDGRKEKRVYSPDGSYHVGYGRYLMLRPGHDMRVDNDAYPVDDEVVRGTSLVRVRSGHRVTAASALVTPVATDGAPTRVATDRKVARELVFTFDAAASDLVYFDVLDGPGVTHGWSVLDRWTDGPTISLVGEPADAPGSLVVATTGSHEISTVSTEIGGATTSTVRLRKAVRVSDLVPDGAAVDFAFDGSGTRVYALATDTGQRLETTTRDLAPGEAWTITAGPRDPWSCGQEPGGPMGCADNFTATVSDTAPTVNGLLVRQPVAVAYPAVGTTGTVSLRLLRQTAG